MRGDEAAERETVKAKQYNNKIRPIKTEIMSSGRMGESECEATTTTATTAPAHQTAFEQHDKIQQRQRTFIPMSETCNFIYTFNLIELERKRETPCVRTAYILYEVLFSACILAFLGSVFPLCIHFRPFSRSSFF